MATVNLVLRRLWDEARDTMSFAFDAPGWTGAQAGQNLLLRLDVPDDPRKGSRTFTVASSPTEDAVVITTRIRSSSPFKRRLAALRPGDVVEARGPMGRFTLPEGDAPLLLFAGGIGVTPFRSMIKYAIDTGRSTPMTLLSSDRVPEMIPYRREMDGWAETHPWLRIRRTITRPEETQEGWTDHVGRMDAGWIRAATDGLEGRTAFVAGPPAFVEGTVGLLRSLGLEGDRVRTERFAGY